MTSLTIGAYQFKGSGDIDKNFHCINKGIRLAADAGVRLLAFHECALTGYPPLEINIGQIDLKKVEAYLSEIKHLAKAFNMYIAVGSVTEKYNKRYNTVEVFSPLGERLKPYDKRALWGWDRESFAPGKNCDIFVIDKIRIGIRICYEVRFPEYFRELYRQDTDFCIVCFCDTSKNENLDRYELIKSHLRTRAVENIMPILSVNNACNYQTAPTAFFDADGHVLVECERNENALLVCNLNICEDDFGRQGRRYINNLIV